MTPRDDRDAPVPGTTDDAPDWGSAAEPGAEPVGLPGNPGFLNPRVPAFAMRDRRGHAVVEMPLTPGPAARQRALFVVVAGTLTALVAGIAPTLVAGRLLGSGALPDGRSAPAWLIVALVVVGLLAGFFLLGVHQLCLGLTGSVRTSSALTWSTVLLGVAAGLGLVLLLDGLGATLPLVHGLETPPRLALVVVAVAAAGWGVVAVLSTVLASLQARALQERLRALRREGTRSPGTLEAVTYRSTWSDDGRPQLDAVVAFGLPGAERRVPLLLVTPLDRVPLVGSPVVVVHTPRDAGSPPATRPEDVGDLDPDDLVLVEIDQSRPVAYDTDLAAYARPESSPS